MPLGACNPAHDGAPGDALSVHEEQTTHSSSSDTRLTCVLHACSNGMVGLGVADGVYGWKEQGIDSGLFSRTLMRYARETIAAGETDPLIGKCHCRHMADIHCMLQWDTISSIDYMRWGPPTVFHMVLSVSDEGVVTCCWVCYSAAACGGRQRA